MLDQINNFFLESFPFREHYFPSLITLLIYLLPLLIGFFTYKKFSKYLEKIIVWLFITIFSSTLILVFVLSDAYQSLVVSYFGFFTFLLFFVGYFIGFIFNNIYFKKKQDWTIEHPPKEEKKFVFLGVLFIIFISLMNFLPLVNSHFLVGADVYFNAAASKNVFTNVSTIHPYFAESILSPYNSQSFSLPAVLSIMTSLDLNYIWLIFVPIFSFIALLSLFALIRSVYGSKVSAITILLVSTINQFLFNDPTMRIVSYVMFFSSLQLFWWYLQKRVTRLKLFFLAFPIILALYFYHLEIFVHFLIFLIFFLFLNFFKFKKDTQRERVISSNFLVRFMGAFALISSIFIILLLSKFDSNSLMVYNEVVFSLVYPIGVISFFVGIFFFLKFTQMEKFTINERFITSLILLASNSLFYFILVWNIHHRYFIETAYIGMGVFCAIFLTELIKNSNKFLRLVISISLIILIVSSISVRYDWNNNYSQGIDSFIGGKYPVLEELNNISKDNSKAQVILASPEDYINRWIPFYTNFYVYTGKTNETKIILPFCGEFGIMNYTCRTRENLAEAFFRNPNKYTLAELEEYRVDYILISNYDPYYIDGKFNLSFLEEVYSGENYELYKIIPTNETTN